MKLRTPIAVALAATTALSLAACHGKSAHESSGGNPAHVSIMVGGLDKVIYLPAELTERLGYFKDEGLDVKLQSEPSGASAETALVAGQVDAVVGFYDHTIDLQSKGKCLESVVQLSKAPGEVEVVSTKSSITSPADFKGKKLGITSPGSSTDFLTQYLAGKAGVSSADYTSVAAGAGGTFVAALQNHGIAAGMTTDPTVQQVTKKGLGKVLLDMRTVEGTQAALGGLYPASSLYMDCSYVQKNPKTVQKLANALVKTLGFIHDHTGAEIAAKMPTDFASGNGGSDTYVAALNASKNMFTADGKMDPAGAQNVLTVLSKFHPDLKGKADQIDLSKTYSTQFVDAAG
jgi:NitT/TauT family transport system substrate-binding protein